MLPLVSADPLEMERAEAHHDMVFGREGDINNLGEQVRKFVAAVNSLVTAFDKSEHVARTTEARALYGEFLQISENSNKVMAKVKGFSWHATRQDRQQRVIKALEQETGPQFGPMKEYIKQLVRSLTRVEQTVKEDSSKNTLERLEGVLAKISKQLCEVQQKEKATKTTGLLGAGAILGAGVGAAGLAVTAIAGPILWIAVVGAMATTGVTYHMSSEYNQLASEIEELEKHVKLMASIAQSLRSTISDVTIKLDSVHDFMDDVTSTYEMPDSLLAYVKKFFEDLVEVGNTCLKSDQKLNEKIIPFISAVKDYQDRGVWN